MDLKEWLPALMALAGYLLGSIPFGIVVSKCLGTVDPRSAGSRNIGFTNVLRVSGTTAGLLTLAGDMGKGWLMGWAAQHWLEQENWVLIVAVSPVLGHLFPVFLGFQGGKGVATAMGAVGGLAPVLGLSMIAIWLVTAALWRYSSGAALASFLSLPLLALLTHQRGNFMALALAVSGLIVWRHKANIVRLWQDLEPKIGQSSI